MAAGRAERPAILDLLFPGRCLLCGEWLLPGDSGGLPLCGACRDRLLPLGGSRCRVCSTQLAGERDTCTRCREAQFAFRCNHSVFAYAGAARQLVTAYKFAGRTRLARYFAGLLARALQERFAGLPVVPVPPRPGRQGPDAVERIARLLERDWGVEVRRCLVRTGGAAQKSLDFAGRAGNLRGRIAVAGPGRGREVPGAAVLLDDVFTTGATAHACSLALAAAGCSDVQVLTLAVD